MFKIVLINCFIKEMESVLHSILEIYMYVFICVELPVTTNHCILVNLVYL